MHFRKNFGISVANDFLGSKTDIPHLDFGFGEVMPDFGGVGGVFWGGWGGSMPDFGGVGGGLGGSFWGGSFGGVGGVVWGGWGGHWNKMPKFHIGISPAPGRVRSSFFSMI